MDTQTNTKAAQTILGATDEKNPYLLEDGTPIQKLRQLFRPVLMGYFEQTNQKLGAYVWAEQKAKEYFETNYKIPRGAWKYRNPRERVVEDAQATIS